MAEVTVVGTGAWGTTLAVLLANAGHDTFLLARTRQEARDLEKAGRNARFRPEASFPKRTLSVVDHPAEALGSRIVVLAVPAASLDANLDELLPFIKPDVTILSVSKGVDAATGRRMSEVITARGFAPEQVCVLSGPNFSAEIALGLPAATVIAGTDGARVAQAQKVFMTDTFRVYTSDDVAGVELGGALKNVVAIACGISDGLGMGQNAKAGLMTRSLAEIARLGVACGARPLTFLGLAGVGDLIATCESDLSRNRRLGLALAAGKSLERALAEIDGVIEGVGTTRAARVLATRHGIEMPVAEELHALLFEGKAPAQSLRDLMRRSAKAEFPELV